MKNIEGDLLLFLGVLLCGLIGGFILFLAEFFSPLTEALIIIVATGLAVIVARSEQ